MRPLVADTELEEDLALLVSTVVGKLGSEDEETVRVKTLKEVEDMLAERVARWPQRWLEEGRQEGRQEGQRLGKAELLKSLAEQRFGELPTWAAERLDRADVDTLDRWSRRLLDAGRLEDVFADSP